MKKIGFVLMSLFFLVFWVTPHPAEAGFIDDLFGIFADDGDADFFPYALPNINDDNVSPDLEQVLTDIFEDNEIDYANVVFGEKIFFGTGPIDTVFLVADSEGVTEYLFIEAVFNDTGVTWTDYHFELGFGWGEDFIPSGADGLDFDTPDMDPEPLSLVSDFDLNIGPLFLSKTHMDDGIWWENGSFDSSGDEVALFSFSLDVPDGTFVPSEWREGNFYLFTLRQYPTTSVIPEPSSMLLLGSGLLGMAGFRRRRKA